MSIASLVALATFAVAGPIALKAAIEDTRTHLLRNVLTAPLAALGLIGLSVAGLLDDQPVATTVRDIAIGAALFAGPWLIVHLIDPAQIGFGDIKYSAGLGLYLGYLDPTLGFWGFFAASAVFACANLALRRSANARVAFGPALLAGATITAAAWLAFQ